jgi:hypothetical protein
MGGVRVLHLIAWTVTAISTTAVANTTTTNVTAASTTTIVANTTTAAATATTTTTTATHNATTDTTAVTPTTCPVVQAENGQCLAACPSGYMTKPGGTVCVSESGCGPGPLVLDTRRAKDYKIGHLMRSDGITACSSNIARPLFDDDGQVWPSDFPNLPLSPTPAACPRLAKYVLSPAEQ